MWCSASDSHLKLLDRVVRSASFLAVGVLERNLPLCRSVAALCTLFKIESNQVHPLSGALPLPYVPARVHSFGPPRCRTSQYSRSFVPIYRCLFGMILVTLCLMVLDWLVSTAEPMLSCWHDLLFLFCLLLFYLFLPSIGLLCLVGGFGLIECTHSLPALHSVVQLIIIINVKSI